MSSNLDRTIVRPGGLTDGSPTGEYVRGVDTSASARPIPRGDVAAFLLWLAESEVYLRDAPVLATRQAIDAGLLLEQLVGVVRRSYGGQGVRIYRVAGSSIPSTVVAGPD